MYAQIRRDMEDTRPLGGGGEDDRSSCMVGAGSRGVRIQVEQLDRSEERAAGQAYDVAHLAERAGAAGLFDPEGFFEPTLQRTIVSVAVWVASRLCEPPDDSGAAPGVDHEVKADGGEGHAEKNEDQ
jgi:hypothetical protein